jgi:hypothetical protein
LYNYTWLIRVIYNLYELALALRVLFYFLRSLYVYNSPYLTRDTHYRLIKYITFGVLLCVTHSDYLAILIKLNKKCIFYLILVVRIFFVRKSISKNAIFKTLILKFYISRL